MGTLRTTLVWDGSSDQALLPILGWTFVQHLAPGSRLLPQSADLRRLRRPPRTLSERIATANDLYPSDVLLIHRDAEREPQGIRETEIEQAVRQANVDTVWIPVIPVRMMEAWLLTNEQAIRQAAGNPAGRMSLHLPPPQRLEEIASPKQTLQEALKAATGKQGRHLDRFNVGRARADVARFTGDFSRLRLLSAFQMFETRVSEFCSLWTLRTTRG